MLGEVKKRLWTNYNVHCMFVLEHEQITKFMLRSMFIDLEYVLCRVILVQFLYSITWLKCLLQDKLRLYSYYWIVYSGTLIRRLSSHSFSKGQFILRAGAGKNRNQIDLENSIVECPRPRPRGGVDIRARARAKYKFALSCQLQVHIQCNYK